MITTRLNDENLVGLCNAALSDRNAANQVNGEALVVSALSSRSIAASNLVLVELQMRYLDIVASNILSTTDGCSSYEKSPK